MPKSTSVNETLNTVLANTIILAQATRAAHWNVVGSQFYALHELFGEQYEKLNNGADEIAERIRTLNAVPVSTLAEVVKVGTLKETAGKTTPAAAALKQLITLHEQAAKQIHAAIHIADEADDEPTEDMLIELLGDCQKMLWMLKASV